MKHIVETRAVDPQGDQLHQFTKIALADYAKSLGIKIYADHTKNAIVGLLYGGGKAKLSAQLGDGKGD